MNTPQEFRALREGLERLRSEGFSTGAALATIIRTQGSTFRRTGARMLVYGDGSVVRGLSGGCPEKDIVTRALRVIASGVAERVRYGRDYGLDILIEQGCDGELEVLIEPLRGPADIAFIDAAASCLERRQSGWLATVLSRNGTDLPHPQRMLWSESGHSNALGGDEEFQSLLSEQLARRATLPPSLETLGEGRLRAEVLIERLMPPLALLAVGINATSLALSRLAQGLGWEVALIDHREGERPAAAAAPSQLRRLHAKPEDIQRHLVLDGRTLAVAMTHDLQRDIAYLNALAGTPLAYLGAIGSRSRARKLREGCSAAASLRVPAGLDVGAETPEEIALAIMAEMLAVVAGRSGAPLHTTAGPMH